MPKLPVIPARKLIKVLKKAGYIHDRTEGMLQAMQGQGIDARVIAKWNPQSGRYELKQIGVDAGDFPVLPGAGYWVRNEGAAKTFNLP